MSIENTIREQLNSGKAAAEPVNEAYPGFGKGREASAPEQGSSSKPGYGTLVKGAGSDAAVKAAAATSLSPSSGPMEKTPHKQGSSNASPSVEDLGKDEPGKVAAAKMTKTAKVPTGKGAGKAINFKDFAHPESVVGQSSSKGNVAQEQAEVITAEEFAQLSEEEQAEYVMIDENELSVLSQDEYDALSDEEKEEYEEVEMQEEGAEPVLEYRRGLWRPEENGAKKNGVMKTPKKPKATPAKKAEVSKKMKEQLEADVNALFAEDANLSEEFKNKAASLFEAVVTARVADLRTEIEEEVAAEAEEALNTYVDELTEKVDGYLNYVVEQWLEQNEVGIVESLRNEITEDFMSGLKNLFKEHYIEVPEEKYDLVGEMATRIEELETKLDEQIDTGIELASALVESRREAVFAEITEGLAQTEIEKFGSLIEDVTFEDEESFTEKLVVLRNNYFPKNKIVVEQIVISDEPVNDIESSPAIQRYAEALSRSVPKF